MSFSTVWRDYNTQRQRRYQLIPQLTHLARGYVRDQEKQLFTLTETLERARKLQEFGFALVGEQFDEEKKLSKEIRSFLIHCHYHHALLLKDVYRDMEHDLLDAEAHMHALQGLIVGEHRKKTRL